MLIVSEHKFPNIFVIEISRYDELDFDQCEESDARKLRQNNLIPKSRQLYNCQKEKFVVGLHVAQYCK